MNDRKIAVLGAGTMGPGIAATYAANGYEVWVYSRTQETLQRAKNIVDANLEILDSQQTQLVSYTTCLEEAVRDTWYIAETIVEKKDAKIALYEQLDQLAEEGMIFASNTSALNIFELVPQRRLPYTVISHWFAPAHILPLVEVIRGPQTLDDVMDKTVALHKSCGKSPVRMERYIPGFIINRLQGALTREVCMLIGEGYCTPEDLDLAVKTSLMPRGMLLGLVQRMDFTGLDMMVNSINNNTYAPPPAPEKPELVFGPVAKGDLGVKTGKGIYDYSDRPYTQVLRQRDEQLLKSVNLAKEFIDNPLHKKED